MVFLKKIINTFFYPRFLFNHIVNEEAYKNLKNPERRKSWWANFLYFYPTVIDAKTWMEGDTGRYRDPNSFVKLRQGIDDFFINYFSKNISMENSVLDLGCNSGRHLNELHSIGYKNLSGVDVMKSALETFQTLFPQTYRDTKLKVDFFQRFLDQAQDDSFDTIYTIGATIELVHPSYDIVKKMCRVAKINIILLIQPDRHNYPRFYEYEFRRNGFELIFKKKVSDSHYLFHFYRN
jgi:SAM-dependent methyltransferase